MIYLRPSRKTTKQEGDILSLGRSYLSTISDYSSLAQLATLEVDNARFRFIVESSNGLELSNNIKETLLTAHLFARGGEELTEHVSNLLPIWEVKLGNNWEQVAEGWSYRTIDRKTYLSVYRVRTTELGILSALGEEIDGENIRAKLQEISVQKEVTVINSSVLFSHIPSTEQVGEWLKADSAFKAAVKGDRGETGAAGKSVTVSEVTTALKADSAFKAAVKGEKGETPAVTYEEGNLIVDGKPLHNFNNQFAKKADASELSNTNDQLSHTNLLALRPILGTTYNSSSPDPFTHIRISSGGNEAQVVFLNLVEGTNLRLPNAADCILGSKIYLSGSAMSCPMTPQYGATNIRPISIYSPSRDVYTPGGYLIRTNTLLETLNYAEFRIDLVCIVAGCGLKAWLWTNYNESRNLDEYDRTIANISQELSKRITTLERPKIISMRYRSTLSIDGALDMTHEYTPMSIYLPAAQEGAHGRLWVNIWDNSGRQRSIRKQVATNIIVNTSTGSIVDSIALTRGHIYEYIAINNETWLLTDRSR